MHIKIICENEGRGRRDPIGVDEKSGRSQRWYERRGGAVWKGKKMVCGLIHRVW